MNANENKRLKRKVRNSYIISTVSIALVLFLLGAVGFIMAATVRSAHELQNNVTLIVELEDAMATDDREAVKERIMENPLVTEVVFSSKEEKLNDREFRRFFTAEFEDVVDNPLLDSYDVRVSARPEQKEELKQFIDDLTLIDGVEFVSYPAALIETMQNVISKARPLLAIFALVLAVISLILLNNTIRLAIFSKRYIINTMKLVGATKWFIMRPFIVSSINQGLAAGAIAAVLFTAAFWGVSRSLPEFLSPERLRMVAITAAAMLTLGVTVSLLFTLAAVNKFVNIKSNKIHLY
ncbi:MAG: cell division protein [Alistipes sp.]|nr:cell division protein [Alistipes sp.]